MRRRQDDVEGAVERLESAQEAEAFEHDMEQEREVRRALRELEAERE